MQPTNHHLAITDQDRRTIHTKVIYLQPKAERWRQDSATVHIETHDWLEAGNYDSLYVTPAQTTRGNYSVVWYRSIERGYEFRGTFTAGGG